MSSAAHRTWYIRSDQATASSTESTTASAAGVAARPEVISARCS